MTLLNKSSYAILGLLSKRDYSGYELKRFMAKISSFYGSESNAQIYPVLKKLEAQRLVKASPDKTSGARNKINYSITEKGFTEFMQWLKRDSELTIPREEFFLQLSLSQHLTREQLTKKITYYQTSIREKINKLNGIIAHIQTQHAGKADQKYLLLTYDHIKTILEAKLNWCNKILKNKTID